MLPVVEDDYNMSNLVVCHDLESRFALGKCLIASFENLSCTSVQAHGTGATTYHTLHAQTQKLG